MGRRPHARGCICVLGSSVLGIRALAGASSQLEKPQGQDLGSIGRE